MCTLQCTKKCRALEHRWRLTGLKANQICKYGTSNQFYIESFSPSTITSKANKFGKLLFHFLLLQYTTTIYKVQSL